jgi:hypothetical protein
MCGGSPYMTVEIKSTELNSTNQGRNCKSSRSSRTNYLQRFVFHTYEQVYLTTWNLVHILVWAGDGEARGGGGVWNSVFLYGKHFAFTWHRASCGSGLNFSVQRYYMQGYQHTGWHFFVTGIAGSILGWESCWPVCGCVFVCLSVCLSVHADTEAVESTWYVMAHGNAGAGMWRGNWRMEWVASTLHTTWEHGVSSITTTDTHTSAASSWLNWRPCRFKWTCPFRRKTKYVFCACAITFQQASTTSVCFTHHHFCHHPSWAVLFAARLYVTQGAYKQKRYRI